MIDPRIARLRRLIAELEHVAPSSERDALLRQARERVVLLQTGEPQVGPWQSKRSDLEPLPTNARDVLRPAEQREERRPFE